MSVPIIGQVAVIVIWYPTVVMQCNCDGKLNLVIMTGSGNASSCGKCGKIFIIQGFSVNDGVVQPVVDIALPTPKSEIQ